MGIRLALTLVLLSLFGCSHLKGPFNPIEGRNFATEKMSQIEEGTTTQDVLQLLGEPLHREPVARGERWRYYVREERVDELRFLSLFPIRKARWVRTTEARLVVADGRVVEVSYESKVSPPE